MALAGVEGASAVTVAISCSGGIWYGSSGSMGGVAHVTGGELGGLNSRPHVWCDAR